MKALIELLHTIEAEIPVTWDRWTRSPDEEAKFYYYVAYGWIERTDGRRDFLCAQMWENDRIEDAFYVTSSAKYSEQLNLLIGGEPSDHNACRKIEELWQLAEENTNCGTK